MLNFALRDFTLRKSGLDIKISYGPRYAKTCLRAYADSESPDQIAHPRSLIRALAAHKQNHRLL